MRIKNAAKRTVALVLSGAMTVTAAMPGFAADVSVETIDEGQTGQVEQAEEPAEEAQTSEQEAAEQPKTEEEPQEEAAAEKTEEETPQQETAEKTEEETPQEETTEEKTEEETPQEETEEKAEEAGEEETANGEEEIEILSDEALTEIDGLQAYVKKAKATVVPNFYGQRVSTVEITFAESVTEEQLKGADISVWDRGTLNPDFGELKFDTTDIKGNKVTLTINDGMDGSDKLDDRSRNSFGMLNTTGWYMDSEGNLYCNNATETEGKDNLGNTINANKAGKTCQGRNLDLILCVDTELADGIRSTDTKGNFQDGTIWEKPEITGGNEKIVTEFVDVSEKTSPSGKALGTGYNQVTEGSKVPVQVIYPDSYDSTGDQQYPVIVYQCGGGVCYWQLAAGENGNIAAANNLGCNTVYDNMMAMWHKALPNAIIMAVNVHSSDTEVSAAEINEVLRYAADNWNIDADKVVMVGNSQGTIITSAAIQQAPELFAGFVECNGNFGKNVSGKALGVMDGTVANSSFAEWTQEEVNAMIEAEVSVWLFNGETDGGNPAVAQDTYKTLVKLYTENGKDSDWIQSHVRISGLQSWKFIAMGETDHSVTKVVADKYINSPYNDPTEGSALEAGETYSIYSNQDNSKYSSLTPYENTFQSYKNFEYTVYAESVAEWAQDLFDEVDEERAEPAQGSFTRAAAAQAFYDYFGWSHRDEYNDIWSPEMVEFEDVTEDTPEWMAIECVLQQRLVDESDTYRPSDVITYAEAVDMFSRAYDVKVKDIKAKSSVSLRDKDGMTEKDWNTLFADVKANFVAPVQALPIANTNDGAPRRYVKLWSPEGEENVTIYFKKTVSTTDYDEDITLDITEAKPYNYTAVDKSDKSLDATLYTQIYTVNEDGYIKEDYSSNTDTYVTYKTVAVDNATGKVSAERIYKWHLHRPSGSDVQNGGYTAELIHEKTATSPAVWQICRDAESLRAMCWYIEGQDAGIVMDALQTNTYNKDGSVNQWNLKEFIDTIATVPYSLVVGHAHPDHDAQAASFINAGIPVYCNDRNWSSLKSVLKCATDTDEQNNARQAAVLNIDEGDSFDLGGCTLDVYTLPGHLDNLVILADRNNGWVFSTDIYGCTRSGSADNVNVSGIPADLLLSLAQQNHSYYEELGVEVSEVYTGHDEVPLTGSILDNFEQCLQNVIDYGDDATTYTLRGGNNKMYARTSMVGDVWKSGTDWLSLLLSGTKGDQSKYLSDASTALYMSDSANEGLNYNFVDGVQQIGKYSVLSNVKVSGGTFHGVDITWKASNTIEWGGESDVPINYTLHNKFNPWYYTYTITPDETSVISINATTMATNAKITDITLDGQQVSTLKNLSVKNGSVITVTVTAPNGVTTSTYTFNVVADLDDVTDLQKDYSQAAQLPLTGYYTKTVANNRTVKVYIAPEASVRSYFTVVAIPDGVTDTYQFLQDNGWIDLANEKGECLYVLEPGANGWGTAQEESDYMSAAISFLKSGTNANGQVVFSTYGEYYLVGYGEGATALEYWAAQNPIFVIAQTYINGKSIGSDALTEVASTLYDGSSSNGNITSELDETLDKVGIDGQIAPKDVAVPTILAGYTGSENYWKSANDCVDSADTDGVFAQDINSKAYATEYANSVRREAGETTGLSQVKITDADKAGTAADIYNYMAQWTRYDTTFAYSNALAERLDYTKARVAAQKQALEEKTIATLSDGTTILGQSDVQLNGHGTVQVGVIAFSDNNDDGKNDPREYMLYIPDGFEGKELPVVMIYPGNTQTDSIFMDSTQWWQLADKEGIALAFVCETYNANPCSVSHADSDKFYNSLLTLLKEKIDGSYADLDFTRVYGSGQSAGSAATQGFAITNPEFFAAVASTSAAATPKDTASNEMIPSMMITGQMDVGDLAQGFDSTSLKAWGDYMVKVNNAGNGFTADGASNMESVDSRHPEMYIWSNDQDIPLVQWAQCILRPHNCYPSDMPILWDFLKHYSMDEDGNRYYSASAFEKDDLVKIVKTSAKKDDGKSDSGSSSGSSSSGSSGSSSSGSSQTTYYSMTAVAHEGGTISSKGVFGVVSGTSKYYEISPNAGYAVSRVIVDGVDVGAVTNYTFSDIRSNHTIEVFFKAAGSTASATGGRTNPQTGIVD